MNSMLQWVLISRSYTSRNPKHHKFSPKHIILPNCWRGKKHAPNWAAQTRWDVFPWSENFTECKEN